MRMKTARKPRTAVDGQDGTGQRHAWVICFAAHVCVVVSMGYFTTLGIFYIEWKEYFDLSATSSSWLVSVPMLVACPLSLFSGVFATRLGIRRVSMVGSVLNGLATILGSFATDVRQLYLCGAMSGVGLVLMVPPAMIILTQYFKTRFALANRIVLLGVGMGQTIFPPLFRLLIANYGWRGTMLIVGAIQMNGVAACALFRPPKAASNEVESNDLDFEVIQNGAVTPPKRTSIKVESDDLDFEVIQNGAVTPPTQITSVIKNDAKPKQGTCMRHLQFVVIFTDLPAMLLLIASALYSIAYITNLTHLPARAKEAGSSDDQSAMLLFSFAIVSMITRATHGWFVDRNYISAFKLQLIALLGAAIVTFLNPVSDNYVFLVGYAIVLGAFIGITSPLLFVIIRSLVHPSRVPASVSLIIAVFFLFNGLGSVIAGKIYDGTGNYVAPFLTAGAFFMASFLLFVFILFLKKHKERKLERKSFSNIPCEELEPMSAVAV